MSHSATEPQSKTNILHGAFGLEGQSGGGRNSAAAADFFASAVGYAKSFVSNNHKFCFLGATETLRKTKSKANGSTRTWRRPRRRGAPRFSASYVRTKTSLFLGRRTCRAAISSSFQWNQLVLDGMHLYHAGTRLGVCKVPRDCFQDVGTKLLPGVACGEDRMAWFNLGMVCDTLAGLCRLVETSRGLKHAQPQAMQLGHFQVRRPRAAHI